MEPFWSSESMEGESLFFVQRRDGHPASARLLFPPEGEVTLRSATQETTFEQGRDFELDALSGTLYLTRDSRIPFKGPVEMYPPKDSDLPKYPYFRDDPNTHLIFGIDGSFHRIQVEASYRHAEGLWKGYVPAFDPAQMPMLRAALREKRPVKLGVTGDSISFGWDASALTKLPPHQPPYVGLVARGLEDACAAKVELANFAVAGWVSAQGLAEANKIAEARPDLAIVAFGMNDSRTNDAPGFAANVRGIVERIRARSPACEFVLVAPMLRNPEWHRPTSMDIFPALRDELVGIAKELGPSAVLADLTAIWTQLLRRKSYHDLSGNGINHPNDFGHRIYAEVVLALLLPESK